MTPTWECPLGDNKELVGIAQQNGVDLGSMAGWTVPLIHIADLDGNEVTRTANLDSATGQFSYILQGTTDCPEPGIYFIRFSAVAVDGNRHSFPESVPATLAVTA